ncbi:MAG: hypothetical protein ACRCV7_03990 [Culicoidibacterales bacterium]
MNKLNMKKVLATGTIIVGGTGMMLAGLGMSKYVDAAPVQTTQSTQSTSQNHHGMKPTLTDEQKEKIRAAKVSATASLSSEDQQTIKNLETKGHFSLTFSERDQLDTIREKMMKYLNEHPIEGIPTPSAKGGAQRGKQKMESTLTDAQKAELDKLKAEGIAQLSAAEQSRLKELDTKERFDQTDAEKQELHTMTEKVMTYVKSKVSFTMPERRGHNRGNGSSLETTQTV